MDLNSLNKRVWFNSKPEDELNWCTNPPSVAVREYIVSKETSEKDQTAGKIDQNSSNSSPLKPDQLSLIVHKLMTNGLGLATTQDLKELKRLVSDGQKIWFYVVPFTLPGELISAKVIENSWGYSLCDLVEIIDNKSASRIAPKCQYFGKCSGCQLQMVDYETQLEYKRSFVNSVFDLENPEILKSIKFGEVDPVAHLDSKSFGYRTKLTPHFEIFKWLPKSQTKIGFNYTNRREIMDIEECVIGTDSVNSGLAVARKNTMDKIEDYKRGATLLIRETNVTDNGVDKKGYVLSPKDEVEELVPVFVSDKTDTCTTYQILDYLNVISRPDSNWNDRIVNPKLGDRWNKISPPSQADISIELCPTDTDPICVPAEVKLALESGNVDIYTQNMRFRFLASSFFQNNNSIIPKLVYHVGLSINKASLKRVSSGRNKITNLVDVYCGAGLFGISLSHGFKSVVGIEISKESIRNAISNASLNNITNCSFSQGDASDIFAKIKPSSSSSDAKLDPSITAVIIDPPRKGSNEEFLSQLMDYGPAVIVYIACGVPAQARDINYLLKNGNILTNSNFSSKNDVSMSEKSGTPVYEISSVTPFDLFPQTYHVENVVTLVRAF
ncbi:tRNA (uracil(54)-C(5))-methyltransferase [Smittium mucronatum]|uniref:tRNA (Uracil(54)-C(5))-methyltransferase n=1 Tax=Smittium mucronatum TaxID=133383 RepID=A0A1R0GTC4_9FUNG|nr:tRNA (uracil(54)-C(5))-methyltransferase [Smittium mucronatum]